MGEPFLILEADSLQQLMQEAAGHLANGWRELGGIFSVGNRFALVLVKAFSEPIESIASEFSWVREVKKIEVGPGDTLVFELAGIPNMDLIEQIRETMKQAFPQHRFLILTNGLTLAQVLVNGGENNETRA